ncbi:unnamed protein product [Mytilus coruscus]|uniref:Uncharacterized protein n=1 Tax=Mytilus coruscus TaxID=42192 RepID=A0A6J8CFV0_MYTCO|nr:unnamed protein product [Mytilus coruscus]
MTTPVNQQPRGMKQYPLNRRNHHFDPASVSTIELPEDENADNGRRKRKKRPSSSPPNQTMSRGEHDENPKLTKKRESKRVILTRIVSALFIVMDCVSDWMQWFDMKDLPLNVNVTSKLDNSGKKCTDMEDITHYYMYFTIAGTAIALIQISNIIYQIRGEIVYKEKQARQAKDLQHLETEKRILRYECSQPCCLWGNKLVIDECKPSCKPWSCECQMCCIGKLFCWALNDPNDENSGQKCCGFKRTCCVKSEDKNEAFCLHRYLGALVNSVYPLLYFINVCSAFCVLPDISFDIISLILEALSGGFGI